MVRCDQEPMNIEFNIYPIYELHHAKICPKVLVAAIPKERWMGMKPDVKSYHKPYFW